jgi:hypothetical protein
MNDLSKSDRAVLREHMVADRIRVRLQARWWDGQKVIDQSLVEWLPREHIYVGPRRWLYLAPLDDVRAWLLRRAATPGLDEPLP